MNTFTRRYSAILFALLVLAQNGTAQIPTLSATTSQPATNPAMTASMDLPALVAKVKPSVVTVLVYGPKDKPLAQGSGFIAEGGKLITNHHVIAGGTRAEVRLSDGRSFKVIGVLANDETYDLAMLAVDFRGSPIADLSIESEIPREGESIVVIGSPLGLEATISNGIISSIRNMPNSETVLQITAPISPGSSGSPVVNMSGRVVGVVKFMLERGQAMNFAAPASRLQSLKRRPPKPLQEWGVARKPVAYILAVQADRAGDYAKAIELYRQAVGDNPRDPEIHTRLGFVYWVQGQGDAAEKCFLDAIALVTESGAAYGWPYAYLGLMYTLDPSKKDLVRAAGILKQGIHVDAQRADTHFRLANVYVELGQHYMALECYKRAVELEPENIQYRVSLGDEYSGLGKHYEAIKAYEQATRLTPRSYYDCWLIGTAYSRLGDTQGAIATYQAAIILRPDGELTYRLYWSLGDEYLKTDPSKAVACFEQAIRHGSQSGYLSNLQTSLLSAYAASGQQEALMNKHKATIRNNPADPYAHYFLGLLLLQAGNRGAALNEYAILKELNKDLAEGLFTAIYP